VFPGEEIVMSKNRKKQRTNRRRYNPEECLSRMNEFGIKDPTPYEMVKEIIKKDKRRSESYEKK
jgi:hypothetical protein